MHFPCGCFFKIYVKTNICCVVCKNCDGVCACFVGDWEDRWVTSKHKSDYGKFEWTSGKFYGDVDKDKGQWSG